MTFKPKLESIICDVRKGNVRASQWWGRPTMDKFYKWVVIVKQYIHKNNINVNMYVCGKFVEKIEDTWDVDVILSHPKARNYTKHELLKIRDLMNYGMQLGFDKFNMLMDVVFYLPFDKDGNFWYSVEEYIKNGKIKSECLYSFDKITINGTINQDLNESYDSCIEIVEGLFIVMKTSPSDKHIKRINEGIYYREPILI